MDAAAIDSRTALAQLPVTRKHELLDRQKAQRGADPFGGFSAVGWHALGATRPARRVFQSPGPIYEPEGHAADYWRFGRALFAAGFRAGDLVHNSFSYHLTPAGSMLETGAHAIGCTVFPGGVGHTELQLQAMAELRATAYAGTPSFLRIVLEKADESGTPLPWLSKASVGGEAFPSALRDALRTRGIEAYQSYGTADVGLIAYETAAREGLVLDEGVIVEIVRPGSIEPVDDGEVGEVVVTALNPDYPMVRFWHRRSERHAARELPDRAHARPHQGLDGPRRPDRQGARHVRARQPGGRPVEAPSATAARGWWSKARWPTTASHCTPKAPPTAKAWARPLRQACATSPSCVARCAWPHR